jgi:hypothetical protein
MAPSAAVSALFHAATNPLMKFVISCSRDGGCPNRGTAQTIMTATAIINLRSR